MKSLTILLLSLMAAAPLAGSESSQLASGDKIPFISVSGLERESSDRATKEPRLGKHSRPESGCCEDKLAIGCLGCFGLAAKCLVVNSCPWWVAACL